MALAVVALQVCNIIFLGTQPLGSLFGNLLQVFCSVLAANFCFRAARRAPGFSQSFWVLVGVGMAMWGVANLGWTYSEVVLHAEPAPGSIIRFLFDTNGMFLVMAIFLNQEKENAAVDLEEVLDFIQIGILFFFVYFGMYYLTSAHLVPAAALSREILVVFLGDLGILLLSLLQWRRGRAPCALPLWRSDTLRPGVCRLLDDRSARAALPPDAHGNLARSLLVPASLVRRVLGRLLATGGTRSRTRPVAR
jgi:hypothetical protein